MSKITPIYRMYPNLSSSQQRYATWIQTRMPFLRPLFDFDNAAFIPETAERYLGTASRGEAIMARFALGVWLGRDRFDFDFTDAAATLDAPLMKIITEWLEEPFWP